MPLYQRCAKTSRGHREFVVKSRFRARKAGPDGRDKSRPYSEWWRLGLRPTVLSSGEQSRQDAGGTRVGQRGFSLIALASFPFSSPLLSSLRLLCAFRALCGYSQDGGRGGSRPYKPLQSGSTTTDLYLSSTIPPARPYLAALIVAHSIMRQSARTEHTGRLVACSRSRRVKSPEATVAPAARSMSVPWCRLVRRSHL